MCPFRLDAGCPRGLLKQQTCFISTDILYILVYVTYIQLYILVHSAADLLTLQLIRLRHGCWRQSVAILAAACVCQPGYITVIDEAIEDVTLGLT